MGLLLGSGALAPGLGPEVLYPPLPQAVACMHVVYV